MSTVTEGIAIGAAGGALAGLTVWVVGYLHMKAVECLHKQRVYSWLKDNIHDEDGKHFRTTRAIASWTNLTEDRVRYICSVDTRISWSTGPNENRWTLR